MKASSQYLFCCDWGTTSFRLSLIDRVSGQVLHDIASRDGTAAVFDQWNKTKSDSTEQRVSFFLDVIHKHIITLSRTEQKDLTDVPVVVSGMASSSIGMKELPYAPIPFKLDGSDIISDQFYDSENNRKIVLISGIRTTTDVMRGEEIQLIGMEKVISEFEKTRSSIIVVLPGTHSKHAFIQNNSVIDFATYLTGEIFEILSNQGLLRQSVLRSTPPENPDSWKYFRQGVQYAGQKPLLQTLFSVRTNDLFKKMAPEDNYHYMSGLLIGCELQGLRNTDDAQIIICGPDHLSPFYENAIDELGLTSRTYIESAADFNQYLIAAQIKIAERYL